MTNGLSAACPLRFSLEPPPARRERGELKDTQGVHADLGHSDGRASATGGAIAQGCRANQRGGDGHVFEIDSDASQHVPGFEAHAHDRHRLPRGFGDVDDRRREPVLHDRENPGARARVEYGGTARIGALTERRIPQGSPRSGLWPLPRSAVSRLDLRQLREGATLNSQLAGIEARGALG